MFLEYTKKKLINKSIVEYLQVKNQDIISVSGAGGKTSTIKLLAKNLVRKHKKVLIIKEHLTESSCQTCDCRRKENIKN